MKKPASSLVTVLVVLGVLAVAFFIIKTRLDSLAVKDLPSEEVVKWIGEHSVLYTQTGCSHCEEQEKLFGENFKYLHVINCAASQEETLVCSLGGITATPTWIINGERYVGVQSIETLKQLTGYQG